ncbi:MAG: nucleotidyltransferase [Elusimicrobiota bacterium]|nr:nucleotidyltransferase [Elusimicrobiota bacterium]
MSRDSSDDFGSDDFDRIVASLNKHHVDFMIIGGFAVVYHGHIRATKDLDLYIRRTDENAERAVAALEEVGFGSPEMTPQVFTADNGISLGTRPLQIDVMSNLRGVDFDTAWARRETGSFGRETVNYISREDLISNKHAAGRPLDLDDARELEKGRDSK